MYVPEGVLAQLCTKLCGNNTQSKMQAVTITQITPPELESLIENSLRKILSDKQTEQEDNQTDQWFDLTELCQYHPDKPSKATVYCWVNAGTIPVHKSAKKLRFLKSEINAWLKQGRKKTLAETEAEAETYLQNYKKRGLK
jgi:excisionase family DNA binding protein